MPTYKNTNSTLRAVTSRIPNRDYVALLAEADRLGSNPSQLMRAALSEHLEKQTIETRLTLLEGRLTRRLFEIISAVAGLTPKQRQDAMHEANINLKEVAK